MSNMIDIQKGCDACESVRKTFTAVVKSLGSNKISTALFTCLPMILMAVALIYFETSFNTITYNNIPYNIKEYKYIILSPLIIISSLTFVFGCLALIGIRFQLQNLLGFCSFVYASIAYWAIITILIILFCIIPYAGIASIGQFLAWTITASIIWLFISAVMDAHRKVVNEAISAAKNEIANQANGV